MEGHQVHLMITKSIKIFHKTLRFMWRIDEEDTCFGKITKINLFLIRKIPKKKENIRKVKV